ncbi:hypothetical protein T05_2896 [Trichinella murrelli]|uniref:Uncharacterized protein n=1 Tax=Trichinella murrelli TaxID=144512 RepID=A0A0V0TST5_9BILA|nr:hypothetical protein T05_2896 [Trichinella murrelli]
MDWIEIFISNADDKDNKTKPIRAELIIIKWDLYHRHVYPGFDELGLTCRRNCPTIASGVEALSVHWPTWQCHRCVNSSRMEKQR